MTTTGLSRNLLANSARDKQVAAKKAKTANGRFSAARARRCVEREKLGALRHRQIRESTKKRYLVHMRAFFLWMEKLAEAILLAPETWIRFVVLGPSICGMREMPRVF